MHTKLLVGDKAPSQKCGNGNVEMDPGVHIYHVVRDQLPRVDNNQNLIGSYTFVQNHDFWIYQQFA